MVLTLRSVKKSEKKICLFSQRMCRKLKKQEKRFLQAHVITLELDSYEILKQTIVTNFEAAGNLS
jgi:hypothetical protein